MNETGATTTAADRAEKKKAQNREAQRAYRHRTKKRLEELQRQIDEHEKNKSSDDSSTPSLRDTESMPADGSSEKQYNMPPSDSSHLCIPYPTERGNMDGKDGTSQEKDTQQGLDYRRSSTTSQWNENTMNSSILGSRKRLSTAPQEQRPALTSSVNFDDQWPFNDLNLLVAPMNDYGEWEEDLDLDFSQNNSDQFLPETSSKNTSSSSISAPTRSVKETDKSQQSPQVPPSDANVEERIEYVISCAKLAKFEDLDSLIMAYYTEDLNPASSISAEQRISRRRRLPQLLANIREQSTHWTPWERIGLEEEIIKTAEAMCTSECHHLRRDWLSSSVFEFGTPNITPKTFQHKLPYLWALLTSIVSSNPATQQHERSGVVFANMILFCLWGRVSRFEIMSWLKICLEGPPNQLGQGT